MKLLSSLTFIAKYILIGLGIAALLVLLLPNRFGLKLQKESIAQSQPVESSIDTVSMLAKAKSSVVTLQVQSKAYPINSRICFEGVQNYSNQQNACQFFNNGSGVVIDADGHLVTSAHVVTFSLRDQVFDQAETILVEFSNGGKITAEIVGIDLESDIALLKFATSKTPYLSLNTSATTQVGETTYAIGTPYMGFHQTVTSGIISAKFFAKVSNYLQIDAQLRSGNSGGALINNKGQLIGITQLSTQDISGEKLLQNFAIQASDVATIVEQLKVNGSVERGWLGLQGEISLNLESIVNENKLTIEQADKLKNEIQRLPIGQGIVITAITKGGPADLAGLKELDIVTQVNGKDIYSTSDLLGAIWNKKPNEEVEVTFWRNANKESSNVILGNKS